VAVPASHALIVARPLDSVWMREMSLEDDNTTTECSNGQTLPQYARMRTGLDG